jgi:hypothetical protein
MQDVLAFIGLGGVIGVSLYLVNEPLGTFMYNRRSQLKEGIAPLPDSSSNSSNSSSSEMPASRTPPPPIPRDVTPNDQMVPEDSLATIVEALVIPLAEEQIQKRELERVEKQQCVEREQNQIREEGEKTKKQQRVQQEQERIQLEQEARFRAEQESLRQQEQQESLRQKEMEERTEQAKKDLALKQQQLLAAKESLLAAATEKKRVEKDVVQPEPLPPKRRVYSWASFTSTPAAEMHQQKKETHYNSNSRGEAATKTAPDGQNDKLLAIHRERKLAYYSEEADSK